MKIYDYNPENGYFIGESFADESPLEKGVYLLPAHSTTKPVPSNIEEGFVAAFINDEWQMIELPKTIVDEIDEKELLLKAKQRQALLDKLGITEEEAKLLLG